jgi:hypothetical protein
MKKIQTHRSSTPPSLIRTLDPRALQPVHGGDTIISPRDPQSGLPTGQRT